MSDIISHLKAGYPLLHCVTKETQRAQVDMMNEIAKHKKDYSIYSWDVALGLQVHAGGQVENVNLPNNMAATNPNTPLAYATSMPHKSVLFLHNYHAFLEKNMLAMQIILNSINALKSTNRHVVILSPIDKIPLEIAPFVTIIYFPLPDEEKIEKIINVQFKALSGKKEIKEIMNKFKKNKTSIINQCLGLTAFEVESAIAHSLSMKGCISEETIFAMKRQMVLKSQCLEFANNKETFADVGGLDLLKESLRDLGASPLAKGLLLLGIAGCGKSLILKALGNELKLPVIYLDFGRIFNSLIGESEAQMRATLDVIDAVGKCIVVIEEIEKGLSGIQSSHKTDGGTGSRVFTTFLNWLQDRKEKGSQALAFGSCNDIQKLPPEFLRAGRWDGIYFVDLPNAVERQTILQLHLKKYNIDIEGCPDLKGYSGAEIESLCRIAKIREPRLGRKGKISDSVDRVIPLSKSLETQIEEQRKWAHKRAIPASTPDQEQKDRIAYQGDGRAVDFGTDSDDKEKEKENDSNDSK